MEINYQNYIEDQKEYIDFVLQSKDHGKNTRIFVIFLILGTQLIINIILFLIAWILSLGSWKEGLQFSLLGLVLSPIFLLFLSKFRPVYYYGKRVFDKSLEKLSEKEKNSLLLPKKVVATPESLQVENALTFHKWNWSTIENIFLAPNLIVIYIDKNFTYLIPKRIFNSEEDFLDFHRRLLEYKKHSA